MDRKVRGFSVFELLVVIVIIAILGSVAFMGLRNMVLRERLYSATTQVVNDLKEVQFRSMSSNATWGIRFFANQSQYRIFSIQSGCRDVSPINIIDKSLPPGVKVNNSYYVVFDRRGYPLNENCLLGMGSVIIENGYGVRRVIVNRFGRIRYE
ncbi:pilus assembly FimT family protein [Thermocrinis jamiesonii]|jgi:prepilin-type N-terminal cleavage/methylation domain|uniref:pilus assembly FimT family protein n=1 Tax=Thermocrinis jamiesonii TaxID=1302351 RepID=UPI0004965CEC|nr:prepilin-type N-terminal cleavage/methylation domain-containing protein [Thermocrinis jamiesonii]